MISRLTKTEEKKVLTKVYKKIPRTIDIKKVIELYEFVNNSGLKVRPKRFLDFWNRKTDDEEYAIIVNTILSSLVDIINENANIKIELSRELTPIVVKAGKLFKQIEGESNE